MLDTYIHECMYNRGKDSRLCLNFVVDSDMTYRFIATCLGVWIAVCATASWVVERLWT